MQALPLIMTVASTAMSVMGSMQEAKYQAAVAKNNAAIATDNANRVRQESAVNAQDADIAAREEIGLSLAESGASGLQIGQGSVLLRTKSKEQLAAKDRGYAIYAGATEAANFQQDAANFTAAGKAGKTAAFYQIGGTLISGASKAYGQGKSAGLIGGSSKKSTPIWPGV